MNEELAPPHAAVTEVSGSGSIFAILLQSVGIMQIYLECQTSLNTRYSRCLGILCLREAGFFLGDLAGCLACPPTCRGGS